MFRSARLLAKSLDFTRPRRLKFKMFAPCLLANSCEICWHFVCSGLSASCLVVVTLTGVDKMGRSCAQFVHHGFSFTLTLSLLNLWMFQ